MRLHDALLYLRPNSKFVVWETSDRSQYMGEEDPIEINGCLVDWKDEDNSCPSSDEVNALSEGVVSAALVSDPRSSFFNPPKDSKADLLAQLAELQAKINAL